MLTTSGRAWFFIACVGQTLFLAYILSFYGSSALVGKFERWSQNRDVIDAYVVGDLIGNIQFGAHILMAAILTFGGMIQVWPQLRQKYRAFHRWNGRVFAIAALAASFGGLWLVWVRGSRLDLASGLGVSLNGIVIIVCVVMAVIAARGRNFIAHERWAMRAFLAVSGVWFLRLGMMAYGLIGIGALGLSEASAMMFFAIWSFGCYLVPVGIYEIYVRAKASESELFQRSVAGLMLGLTGLSVVGIGGATIIMWWLPVRATLGL
jgi:hypothetical protein